MNCPVCQGILGNTTSTIRIMWDKKKVEVFEITSHNDCSDQLYKEIQQINLDDYTKDEIIAKYNLSIGE